MRPKRIILTVKQKHIDQGIKDEQDKCALALALRERGYIYVWVSYSNAHYYDPKIDKTFNFRLSPEASDFINAFDLGKKIEPARFTLVEVT